MLGYRIFWHINQKWHQACQHIESHMNTLNPWTSRKTAEIMTKGLKNDLNESRNRGSEERKVLSVLKHRDSTRTMWPIRSVEVIREIEIWGIASHLYSHIRPTWNTPLNVHVPCKIHSSQCLVYLLLENLFTIGTFRETIQVYMSHGQKKRYSPLGTYGNTVILRFVEVRWTTEKALTNRNFGR